MARRLALFYAAQSIASAFGGLLAFGVFQIQSGPLANWRYLFLIEGLCTLSFSVFAFWYLPYSAATARFLNEEEKKLAFHRIQVDSSSEVNEKFALRDALKIFKHPTSWIILGMTSRVFTDFRNRDLSWCPSSISATISSCYYCSFGIQHS